MKKTDDNKLMKKLLVDSGLENILSDMLKLHGEVFLIKNGDGFHLLNGQSNYLYFLVEGKIQISFFNKQGDYPESRLMNPVCLIGDIDLFSEIKEIVNFKALIDSILIGFKKEYINTYDYNNPIFTRFTINNPKTKTAESAASFLNHEALPLKKRLLCYLHSRWFETDQLQFPIDSREYLAEAMDVTPRYIGKILREFEDSGIIRLSRYNVTIIDPKELSILVNEEDCSEC